MPVLMKKASFIPALLLCIVFFKSAVQGQNTKSITLDDCFTFYKFYPQTGVNFQYLKDGVHYAEADHDGRLHIRDVRNANFDSTIVLKLTDKTKGFDQFEFSEDETKLLIRTDDEPVYRHSVLANYFVYDFKTGSVEPVFEKGKQQFVCLSPDATKVAFIFDNNLYINYLDIKTTVQITKDGEKNKIINGLPDWVYEEEFSPVDGDGMVATRWSPDGTMLAYIRFDETEVPEMPLTWYEGGVYPRRSSFKYPKVGAPNSKVSVHVYDLGVQRTLGKVMGLEPQDYCPRINWTPEDQLVITRLNRRQDTLDLLVALMDRAMYDQEDKTTWIPTRLLFEETDPAYIDVESENKLVFLEESSHYLWMSERSGWNHIYRQAWNPATGERPVALTRGTFDVTAFYGVDEKKGKF
jgi:dipeptidyl-peptidase-4